MQRKWGGNGGHGLGKTAIADKTNGAMFVRGSFKGGFIGQIESLDGETQQSTLTMNESKELAKAQLKPGVGASVGGGLSILASTA
jgi:hypothetical protein